MQRRGAGRRPCRARPAELTQERPPCAEHGGQELRGLRVRFGLPRGGLLARVAAGEVFGGQIAIGGGIARHRAELLRQAAANAHRTRSIDRTGAAVPVAPPQHAIDNLAQWLGQRTGERGKMLPTARSSLCRSGRAAKLASIADSANAAVSVSRDRARECERENALFMFQVLSLARGARTGGEAALQIALRITTYLFGLRVATGNPKNSSAHFPEWSRLHHKGSGTDYGTA